jgi:hypothetical protein
MTSASVKKEIRKFVRDFNNALKRYKALPEKDRKLFESWSTQKQKTIHDAYLAESDGKATKKQQALLKELKSEIPGFKKLLKAWLGQFRYWTVIHLYSIGDGILEAIRTVDAVYGDKMTTRQYKLYEARLLKKGIKKDIKPLFRASRKRKKATRAK